MSSSFQSGKKAVDLAAPPARVSRIRRDPPPPAPKVVTAADVREQDARNILIGVVSIGLALFIILIGFGRASGWSPSQYTIHVEERS